MASEMIEIVLCIAYSQEMDSVRHKRRARRYRWEKSGWSMLGALKTEKKRCWHGPT